MTRRRIARTAAGLIAGLAGIGLLGLPAAASTVTATATDGTLEIFTAGGSVIASLPLDDAGSTCATPTHTLTTTVVPPPATPTEGTFTWAHSWDGPITLLGVSFRVTITRTESGTWELFGDGYNEYTLDPDESSIDVTFQRTTSPCTPSTAFSPCVVSSTQIVGLGHMTTADLTDPTTDDTYVWSGSNGDYGEFGFETTATGTGCGGLGAADDGSVLVTDEELVID